MLTYLLLTLTGLVVGSMNAIAGGGTLIGFPIMVALGIPPLIANATSNLVILPGQVSSAVAYRRHLRHVPWTYALLLIPIAIGSITGAILLRHTSPTYFAHVVPTLVLFAVVLFAVQPFIHRHLHHHLHSRSHKLFPLLLIGLALLPTAVYGGYFGAGYGFITLAFLGFTKLNDIHQMNALKNIASVVVAGSSLIVLASAHLIDWRAGLAMAIGTTIGGYFGAWGAQKVSTHAIRIAVIAIGLIAVVFLGLHSY